MAASGVAADVALVAADPGGGAVPRVPPKGRYWRRVTAWVVALIGEQVGALPVGDQVS